MRKRDLGIEAHTKSKRPGACVRYDTYGCFKKTVVVPISRHGMEGDGRCNMSVINGQAPNSQVKDDQPFARSQAQQILVLPGHCAQHINPKINREYPACTQ
ncbi:hypothetical protein C5167_001828 [Papaver somniferum]|uniref:Uncharacterized protein n=1 Tax=Papaver somniferum TaxID=3469 RepID=A0A4Y7KYW6_PAPSO|nr:hypothetical protein C5167_001828 [Papaver somniferum]